MSARRKLTLSESTALLALVRVFGATAIARRFGVRTYTLERALLGIRVNATSLDRVCDGLHLLALAGAVHFATEVQ